MPTPARPRRNRSLSALPALPAALAVAVVVLGSLAGWFGVRAHDLRTSTAARNTALTDTGRTSQVNGQITQAVNTVFSYDYQHPGRTTRAEHKLLTGSAVAQYRKLFSSVHEQAKKQKLVLTTTVSQSGVEMLQGDHAHLLVFADERDASGKTGKTSYAGAMIAVDTTRTHGTWRISAIDTFTDQ